MPEPPVDEQLIVMLLPSAIDVEESLEVFVKSLKTVTVQFLVFTVPLASLAFMRIVYFSAYLGVTVTDVVEL